MDILVKPMQRLTKYSLLLKAVLKHSSPSQQEVLSTMVRQVDEFVNHVNSTLKRNHELLQLKQLSTKLESYDVVETKDDDLAHLLHKYAMLSLTDPIPSTDHHRCLLFESDLKFKDASAKMEVHCFLLTDMLLISKAIKRLGEPRVKYKVIRQPFAVDRLITQEMAREPPSLGCVYINQYNTAVTAFILSCSEPDLIKVSPPNSDFPQICIKSFLELDGIVTQSSRTIIPTHERPKHIQTNLRRRQRTRRL